MKNTGDVSDYIRDMEFKLSSVHKILVEMTPGGTVFKGDTTM